MNLTLNIWRQKGKIGKFVKYQAKDVSEHMSFLEMLDVLNQELILKGEEPVHFDHDCREGICGTCGMVINGLPHGPLKGTTVCQLHMRHFKDGQEIWIEPWRSRGFPILKDLMTDKSALIASSNLVVSLPCALAKRAKAEAIPVPKSDAELSMDAAECIGCGACGLMPQRFGDAVRRGQDHPSWFTPRPARTHAKGHQHDHEGRGRRVWILFKLRGM